MPTTQSQNYVFDYDTRYYALKSDPPTLAKLTLRGGQLHYERIEIPRVGTGTKSVRLKGVYTGLDGDVFLQIDGGYAEVCIVHHGLQFAIWRGDSENLSAQRRWLVDFLAGDPLSVLHVLPRLEHHLTFMRERGILRPGEETALLDLIAKLREVAAAHSALPR